MKTDDIRINKISSALDRRRKLTDTDRGDIKVFYELGYPIRRIAAMYEVDKRLIQFILFPERHALNLEHRKKRGGTKQYYDKDKWRETMRDHRAYKRRIVC